ncbi:hypothetical protein [Novosphingobium sp. TCA1]|uniref:hypothetical protein n=1 Tax=Novosphingobium sp. TCA1 TaxID=2682474 RepID=UPI0010EFB068|nr:hypothetical protein [Novosphingobium sp. TCA1]
MSKAFCEKRAPGFAREFVLYLCLFVVCRTAFASNESHRVSGGFGAMLNALLGASMTTGRVAGIRLRNEPV